MLKFFKRRPRNRRLERDHVLDVKLRTQQTRMERARLIMKVVTILAALTLAVFLCRRGGEWVLDTLLYRNDAFALQVIDVKTDGVVPADTLRRWAGVKSGDNLWALDMSRVERELLLRPVVRSVALEREFPYTLRIRVCEREPIAQVLIVQSPQRGGGFLRYFLDEEGHVMQPLEGAQVVLGSNPLVDNLPALTGLSMSELRPGHTIETPKVRAALSLIRAFEQSPMAGVVDLRSLDISGTDVIQVATGQGSEVTFSTDRLVEQLRRWRQVHDYGVRRNKLIATLDLSVTNHVPARWMEAGSTELPALRAKPLRPRRKHA